MTCKKCGVELTNRNNTILNPVLCNECFIKHKCKCDYCNKQINYNERIYPEKDEYGMCRECFNRIYEICSHCKEIIHVEEIIVKNKIAYCPKCRNEIDVSK